MQARSTLIAFWGNYENVSPKLVWWCVSVKAWLFAVSSWPWGGSGCMESSSSLAGMSFTTFQILPADRVKRKRDFWMLRCTSPRQPRRPHTNCTEYQCFARSNNWYFCHRRKPWQPINASLRLYCTFTSSLTDQTTLRPYLPILRHPFVVITSPSLLKMIFSLFTQHRMSVWHTCNLSH